MDLDERRLAELMTAIDPAVTPVDDSLTPERAALLRRIKSERGATPHLAPLSSRTRRWRRASIVSTVIATMVLIGIALIPAITGTSRAEACTPASLDFSGPTPTVSEVLRMTNDKLSTPSDVMTAQRSASYTGWYLQVDNRPDQKSQVAISPQITNLTWFADRSGRLVVTAGKPYWADGNSGPVSSSHAPTPGTVLSDVTFRAGQFDVPSTEVPGATETDLHETLTALGMPEDADSFTMIESVRRLLTLWTLDNRQEAALLHILLHSDNVTVNGTATDRAGRRVIGISADSSDRAGLRNTLLISTKTARIVGIETTRTTSHGNVPPGAVVAYTLWKDTN